jgi:hypothetical protein
MNISVRGLFACKDGLQGILTADDPDGLVVDFDGVDYRADVALLGVGIALVELAGHQARKCINLLGIYSRDGAASADRTISRLRRSSASLTVRVSRRKLSPGRGSSSSSCQSDNLRSRSHASKKALRTKIEQFIAYFNRTMAKPFRWTMQAKPLTG